MNPHIIVIGGGITGLSAAHRLCAFKKNTNIPLNITLLESGKRLGGVVRSERLPDYIIEHGPDSFIDQPAAINLCKELGLENQIGPTNESNRKAFIAFQGKLHEIPQGFSMVAPSNFASFALSPLFSISGKLRALMDLILPKRSANDLDESAADFIKRRLGTEIFERAAQPLLGGIYMADLSQLSAQAAMGRFVDLESKYGSIIRGLLMEDQKQLATASGARYGKFITLNSGMQSLVDALSNSLAGEQILLSSTVLSLNYLGPNDWKIELQDGKTLRADGVIISSSAAQAAKMLANLDSSLKDKLSSLQTTSSAVVNLLFDRRDIGHLLNGFGFVVPALERKRILACAFISVKFPKRAPANMVMLRVFIGGSSLPEHRQWSDDELKLIAVSELKPLLKLSGNPIRSWVARWPNSMPQYQLGHLKLISEIEAIANRLPGLKLAGNSYSGVGVPDCIINGQNAAQGLLETLQKPALL